jgi:pyruvate-formate lyase-activating enzyme
LLLPVVAFLTSDVMNRVEYDTEGVLFNIQRYSLHDGPGIRTIPFFKGCPLACKWCSNPESQRPQPELIYKKSDCIRCGKCVEVCQQRALSLAIRSLSTANAVFSAANAPRFARLRRWK